MYDSLNDKVRKLLKLAESAPDPAAPITTEQAQLFRELAREAGWFDDELQIWLREAYDHGLVEELSMGEYVAACDEIWCSPPISIDDGGGEDSPTNTNETEH